MFVCLNTRRIGQSAWVLACLPSLHTQLQLLTVGIDWLEHVTRPARQPFALHCCLGQLLFGRTTGAMLMRAARSLFLGAACRTSMTCCVCC